MSASESRYPQDWLAIAAKDLRRVEVLLAAEDPEGASFFLQQIVEKYLKAFLLSRGWRLERTHDLDALLSRAVAFDPTLEAYRPLCQAVAQYYTQQRYPLAPPLDERLAPRVRLQLAEATRLAAAIERRISESDSQ